MLASELFAKAMGTACFGKERCHWCGGPAERTWVHDDDPPIPFEKPKNRAKRPNELYVCIGCWLWRRPKVTVKFLGGSLKDGQSARNHSWLITNEEVWGLKKYPNWTGDIWDVLLKPPLQFVLAIQDREQENHLHLATINCFTKILAETPILFTVNGTEFTYSVYEVEMAHRFPQTEQGPGVRELIRLFGPCPKIKADPPEQNGVGRPSAMPRPQETVKKEITK